MLILDVVVLGGGGKGKKRMKLEVVKHVAYDVKVRGTNDERRNSGRRESFVNLKCTIIRLNQSVFPGVSLSLSPQSAFARRVSRF